jgi:hypothetical protein
MQMEAQAMGNIGGFWEDLQMDLEDPEFRRTFTLESTRIKSLDAAVNALDDARAEVGLSKAELARALASGVDSANSRKQDL